MTYHILLDSSPLSLLSSPSASGDVVTITQWSRALAAARHRIYIPEVIDYELRQELLRAGKSASVAKLGGLQSLFTYLPITTDAMLRAAELWAQARRTGFTTGDPKKLDIDVILAAQALTRSVPASDVIVVTSNVSHLSRFVTAKEWKDIAP